MTAIEFNNSLIGLKEGLEYFAYSLTSNKEDAKDLVQDTFLKALTNRDKFQENTNLKAWAYTILRNTFINKYRRAQKTGTVMDNTEDLYYMNFMGKSRYGMPESEISIKEISKIISTIGEDQRIPFEMQNAGYKYKEIAEQMDLSIGTVKSRIFFCRKKLMSQLNDYKN